jgi:hypothetical protein
MSDQKPSVGRVVHYTATDFPYKLQAAIITDVHGNGTVFLHVFGAGYTYTIHSAGYTTHAAGTQDASGSWTWPARV